MFIFQLLAHLKPTAARFFLLRSTVLLLFFFPLATYAETTKSLSMLSWKEAASLTLAQNPRLLAFGYQLKAQAGRIQQAGLKPNPELSLIVENAFGSGELNGIDRAETTLSISWVIESQRRERVTAAQVQNSVLEVERDIQRLDALAATARLYIAALALQAKLQQADNASAFTREAVKVINGQVHVGKSPAAEAMRANVELSRRLLEREDIEHELALIQRRLAAQWGADAFIFSRVAGDIVQLPKILNYDTLRERLSLNPRMQYFVTNARLQESQLALAKAQSKPQWRLSAGIKHLAATNDQAVVAGISAPLTVFDRQQGRLLETRALMALNRAQQDAEKIQLETDLFGFHQELLHSLHIAKGYREDILPALDAALSGTRHAYESGRYRYLEWQSVQREFLEANNILIEASVAAHLNAIEIERLTGVDITPYTE